MTAIRKVRGLPSNASVIEVSTTALPNVPLPNPTGQPPELIVIGGPKLLPLQTRRATDVMVALLLVVVTVVSRICSTPVNGPFAVATVHPVAGLWSVSRRTL